MNIQPWCIGVLVGVMIGSPLAAAQASSQSQDTTVVGVATGTPDFSTLVSALSAAGLTETLQGSGPFTVFAPTNEAFAKLSKGDLDALLADPAALTKVLSYHVVPGSFTTSDITEDMKTFTTLEGSPLPITQRGVGDAAVTAVNIPASNGVLFAIDTVLTPPAQETSGEATGNAESGGGGLYSSAAEASERYTLAEVSGSGVSGSALIAEYSGNRTVVSISLSNPAGGTYPAALYLGSCDDLSRVVAALEPVSGATGFSTTVLDVPFSDIVGGDHALNITAAEGDSAAVACGEVGQ